jgi:hypothetical protein
MIFRLALAGYLPNFSDSLLRLGACEGVDFKAVGLADHKLSLGNRLAVDQLELLGREISGTMHDSLIPNREMRDFVCSFGFIVLRAHFDDVYFLRLHHSLRDLLVEPVLLSGGP